jgi:hypothetical protein
MRWPILVSAGCGAIYGYAFGSDLADIAAAFLPQDLIGQWIAGQAAYALPIGGIIGGVAALMLITALGAADLSTVIGMAGGTIVGLVIERPQSWQIIHPLDVFSAFGSNSLHSRARRWSGDARRCSSAWPGVEKSSGISTPFLRAVHLSGLTHRFLDTTAIGTVQK